MADLTLITSSDSAPSGPEKTTWPFRIMAGALLLSIFLSAFVLPSPEGLELVRDLIYVAIVAVFIIRWRLAVVRHEQSRSWSLYFTLILLAPLIVFLSEPILKAL